MSETVSELVRNYATAFSALAGASVAVWKWGFEERLRKKREIVSPDGYLSTTIVPLDMDKVVVTIVATWRNKGPFSIFLDKNHSYVSVTQIRDTVDEGPFALEREMESSKHRLFNGVYIMEPKTDSEMHQHFVLPNKGVYLFRWVIALDSRHSKDFRSKEIIYCSREVVINVAVNNL